MSGKRQTFSKKRPSRKKRLPGMRNPHITPQKCTHYPIGRIIVNGEAYFEPELGGKYLHNTLKNHWPNGTSVDFLITPGAFIYEDIKGTSNVENNRWDAKSEDISSFVKLAKENVKKMLNTGNIIEQAKSKAEYLTIGSDICFCEDYRVELVFIIKVSTGKIVHWTGKSYPTNSTEVRELIQVTDLKTHFMEFKKSQIMILGCHDLTMFSHRSHSNLKEGSPKHKRVTKMIKITKKKKPTIVIQHPHTTQSPNVWRTAWGSLRKDFSYVKAWASGISYIKSKDERNTLERVLKGTKSGDDRVVDILLNESC